MNDSSNQLLIILTEGRADNGRKATLAFAMGMSALAMGVQVKIFLTSDGAVWGYNKSAFGIAVPGFLSLDELIEQYLELDGELLLCSTCHLTCCAGDPRVGPQVEKINCVSVAGMATVMEQALQSTVMTF